MCQQILTDLCCSSNSGGQSAFVWLHQLLAPRKPGLHQWGDKAGRGYTQQERFGGEECSKGASRLKLWATTWACWRHAHKQAKTSHSLNVSQLPTSTQEKLIDIWKRKLHVVVKTVFPNLVVTREVPKGPQTRGKVHGKCKWTGEAVSVEFMLLLLGDKSIFASPSAPNICRHRFSTANCCQAAPWNGTIDDYQAAFRWEV